VNAHLFERSVTAYAHALRVLDPLRFQLWSDRGLTMPQARVLFTLIEHGERSAGELADELAVTPPTITGITDRLVKQGLVERREDQRDRRIVRLCLTGEGRQLTVEIAEKSRAYLRGVFQTLTEARLTEICSALEDLAAANAKVRESGLRAAATRQAVRP
jgi:DNA-binding MarR family transcriptional regulator